MRMCNILLKILIILCFLTKVLKMLFFVFLVLFFFCFFVFVIFFNRLTPFTDEVKGRIGSLLIQSQY